MSFVLQRMNEFTAGLTGLENDIKEEEGKADSLSSRMSSIQDELNSVKFK